MGIRTHYEVLGVGREADAATIREAYRERARLVHPDRRSTGSAPEMAALNEAYRVLRDPGRRAGYDRSLDGHGPATGSAVPPSARPAASPGEAADEDVMATVRRPTYNYAEPSPQPMRMPWRFIALATGLGIAAVLAAAAFIDGPAERPPDGVLHSGSCVEVLANTDVREVHCEGAGDRVVDQLVPFGEPCPSGTAAHRDQLGRGMACVLPPRPSDEDR